jgi:hypothetical protein
MVAAAGMAPNPWLGLKRWWVINGTLSLLLGVLALASVVLLTGSPAMAAPVSWREVPAAPEGRQWWDAGSLRWTRDGHLRLLSRFQPSAGPEGSTPAGALYLMEVDCQQKLFRDVSVNGLHQFRSTWQLSDGDPLIEAVIVEACQAAPPLG